MKKAIFLDRDGIINKERGEYTYRKEDFEILPDVIEVMKKWREMGFELVVISNQGGVAKKIYSHEQVKELHQFMNDRFETNDLKLTAIYYCPHHPDFVGKCLCRKPDSLLFEKALAKFHIDPNQSYMIGDKDRDILPAQKLGMKTFKVGANGSLKNLLSLIR
jgi:D-glycero-D-manno-heptose 1,7-bisphosphate phosphatase